MTRRFVQIALVCVVMLVVASMAAAQQAPPALATRRRRALHEARRSGARRPGTLGQSKGSDRRRASNLRYGNRAIG